MLSVLDMFRVGVGPSSSHTVGPMRIALRYGQQLARRRWTEGARVVVTLQGSLAFTGHGHGTLRATALGLLGHAPETFDAVQAERDLAALERTRQLSGLAFDPATDIRLDYETRDLLHPNAMRLAVLAGDAVLAEEEWFSTGGGFIASRRQLEQAAPADRVATGRDVPHPFASAAELLAIAEATGQSLETIVLANEDAIRPRAETLAGLDHVAAVMLACIDRGLTTEGILPGGLKVERRAPSLWQQLQQGRSANEPERLFDWLNVYAMAVNEENAAGGQVVTAPTNGAAGILPAVMKHYCEGAEQRRRFLATAAEDHRVAALEPDHLLARLRPLHDQRVDPVLGQLVVLRPLADVDHLTALSRPTEDLRATKGIVDEDIGHLHALLGAQGDEAEVAGAGADKVANSRSAHARESKSCRATVSGSLPRATLQRGWPPPSGNTRASMIR
jgi:iron-sulfur-dependent L-serine dehydratase single chain form